MPSLRSINRRSSVITATAAAVGAGLLLTTAPLPAQAGSGDFTIKKTDFGIHDFTNQEPGLKSGAIRLNFTPPWRTVQPRRNGRFHWKQMDAAVAQARAWGYEDILFAFAGTPSWNAGRTSRQPFDGGEPLGPGSTAPPKDMGAWRAYVTATVSRYKDKVDYWQTWNEATSPQYYNGTGAQMARMTQILNRAVKKKGGNAKVVSASVQTHWRAYWEYFAPDYFRALNEMGWPVDVLSGHFYPTGSGGPDRRIAQIGMFNRALDLAGAPRSKQRWDTEVNSWVSFPIVNGQVPNPASGRITGSRAQTWVARNYLDTWRTGLRRSYWYTWEVPGGDAVFPGIKTRTGDPATAAYNTLAGWTIGARHEGCNTSGALVTCHFTRGSSFDIAFTTRGTATVRFLGTKQVCKVSGAMCTSAIRSVSIGAMPTKIG